MAQLSSDTIIRIIDALEEKGDPFYPVSRLAHELGFAENDANECASLSTEFVSHMLHLQDLGCIENINGRKEWGYDPLGDEEALADVKIATGDWATPHCYWGDSYDAVIRPTAIGRQVRDALKTESLPSRIKTMVLNGGGQIAMAVMQQLAVSQVG